MVKWWCCGARSLKAEHRFPAGPRSLLRWFQSGRNRLGRMKKVWLFSNWQAQGGEDRFRAGPRALLSWFQIGRKGLRSCNRFEELNKYLLTAYFEVIQKHCFQGGNILISIFDQGDGEKDDVTM